METTITVKHDGPVVTDIVTVQETGKASLVKVLHALGVWNDDWRQTTLQITASVIRSEEERGEEYTT